MVEQQPVVKMADLGPIAAYPSPPNYNSPPDQKPSLSSVYDKSGMSSSVSPNQPGQAFSGAGGQDKSPLSTLNLNFLKSLADKRTTRGKTAHCRRQHELVGC